MPDLMTTREVADYLRIKQRKIYEMVRARDIPCTRVTGKWLFPRHLVDLWLMQGTEGPAPAVAAPAPPIVAGSHDPLLEWALRESDCELAMYPCGSTAGLERLADGRALAAGLHLLDDRDDEYNVAAVRAALGAKPVVVVQWAWRAQGLVVAPGNPLGIEAIGDLAAAPARIAHRQDGSGSELLFRRLLKQAGLTADQLALLPTPAKSETDLGLAVHEGEADAGLAVEAAARQLRLGFVKLADERFDLAMARRDFFEPAMQRLLGFARTSRFRRRADELGGYDVAETGRVVWNAP